MREPKITRAELIIWSAIIIAFVCIGVLCVTRDTAKVLPSQPVVRGRTTMKKPGTEELPIIRHDPRPQDLPVVKKEASESGLKRED